MNSGGTVSSIYSKIIPATVTACVGASEGDREGTEDGASVTLALGIMDGDELGAGDDSEGLELGDTVLSFRKNTRKMVHSLEMQKWI